MGARFTVWLAATILVLVTGCSNDAPQNAAAEPVVTTSSTTTEEPTTTTTTTTLRKRDPRDLISAVTRPEYMDEVHFDRGVVGHISTTDLSTADLGFISEDYKAGLIDAGYRDGWGKAWFARDGSSSMELVVLDFYGGMPPFPDVQGQDFTIEGVRAFNTVYALNGGQAYVAESVASILDFSIDARAAAETEDHAIAMVVAMIEEITAKADGYTAYEPAYARRDIEGA